MQLPRPNLISFIEKEELENKIQKLDEIDQNSGDSSSLYEGQPNSLHGSGLL